MYLKICISLKSQNCRIFHFNLKIAGQYHWIRREKTKKMNVMMNWKEKREKWLWGEYLRRSRWRKRREEWRWQRQRECWTERGSKERSQVDANRVECRGDCVRLEIPPFSSSRDGNEWRMKNEEWEWCCEVLTVLLSWKEIWNWLVNGKSLQPLDIKFNNQWLGLSEVIKEVY